MTDSYKEAQGTAYVNWCEEHNKGGSIGDASAVAFCAGFKAGHNATLRGIYDQLADAQAVAFKASQPILEAITAHQWAITGIKSAVESMIGGDYIGTCESCETRIFEGDDYYSGGEIILCPEHTPTYGDIKHEAETEPEAYDSPEDAAISANNVQAYVDAGGSLDDKCFNGG